jgi:spoIIIJ-associated protein
VKEIVKEAKTVEGAIALVLDELGCTKDDLNIEILQEPVKGIFGLVKSAKIKASFKNREKNTEVVEIDINGDEYKKIHEILTKLLSLMSIKYEEIRISKEGEYAVFEIVSESEGLLIGHHGKTIEAFQYLINKIINPKEKEKTRFFIDIGGYLEKHKQNLKRIADVAVKKVKESNEEVKLVPMNAYDRRIIHLHLKESDFVRTQSEGEGSMRHVVVLAK